MKIAKNCYNMEILKSLFEKIACKHQWKMLARTEYADGFQYLFVCEKCGKMKKNAFYQDNMNIRKINGFTLQQVSRDVWAILLLPAKIFIRAIRSIIQKPVF